MKVTILQENLTRGLNLVSRIVSAKATLPILGNVLISSDQGKLKLSATNLEVGLNLWIGAKIDEEGSLTIPARVFSEFVASLPSEKVEISASETSLNVDSGSFKANFVGTLATEFPQLPSSASQATLIFDRNDFVRAVSQVAYAASQDESRPVLTGVLFKAQEGKLTLVATDGYRLSLKAINPTSSNLEGDLLIPAKTLLEVVRIAGEKGEKEIKLSLTPEKSQVIFSLPDIEFSSRLLEGDFPDFGKIIPKESTAKIEVDKEDFLKAVKIASIFAREQANIVVVKVEENKIALTAETPQVGANESEVEAKVEGESFEIAFNCRFLIDFLNSCPSETVIFEANGPLSPGVFKGKDDETYVHIIMPIRRQG